MRQRWGDPGDSGAGRTSWKERLLREPLRADDAQAQVRIQYTRGACCRAGGGPSAHATHSTTPDRAERSGSALQTTKRQERPQAENEEAMCIASHRRTNHSDLKVISGLQVQYQSLIKASIKASEYHRAVGVAPRVAVLERTWRSRYYHPERRTVARPSIARAIERFSN